MKRLLLVASLVFAHCIALTEVPFGGQSMVAPLKKVLVRRPDSAFGQADPVRWHYTSKPNLEKAQQEHDAFTQTLRDHGAEIVYHDEVLPEMADSIFVHDPVLMTNAGAIILNMGKELRKGEPSAVEAFLRKAGIPILYKMQGIGTVEGGDCLWLDEQTLAVGHGFRTNTLGILELSQILGHIGVNVLPVQLPYYQGPDACLHLQSLISLVAENIAVVYKPLTPVVFLQELELRGFTIIEVPDEEFLTMGPNILAIQPRLCVTIEGNPVIKKRLEDAGVTVLTYKGDEISHKAEGGATCLTRPLLRG